MTQSAYSADQILTEFPVSISEPQAGSSQHNGSGPRAAPEPLLRDVPPAQPFPVDALGVYLAPAARAIHDIIQAPLAICAQSVLATANFAVQPLADVVHPNGQVRPIAEYYLTIAATGERKTACDHEAQWPVRKREATLRQSHRQDLLAYDIKKAAWDRQQKQILSSKKSYPDQKSKTKALNALVPPSERPLEPILTCPDPTIEGLWKALSIGQPSMAVFAHEGGQFVGGYGMTADNKLRTAAGFSALWDGDAVRVVRASGISILPIKYKSPPSPPKARNRFRACRYPPPESTPPHPPSHHPTIRYPLDHKLKMFNKRKLPRIKVRLPLKRNLLHPADPS